MVYADRSSIASVIVDPTGIDDISKLRNALLGMFDALSPAPVPANTVYDDPSFAIAPSSLSMVGRAPVVFTGFMGNVGVGIGMRSL